MLVVNLCAVYIYIFYYCIIFKYFQEKMFRVFIFWLRHEIIDFISYFTKRVIIIFQKGCEELFILPVFNKLIL